MTTPILRRALLYVPGSSSRFLAKSRGLNVDTVAYDLEDSVAPDRKADARLALRDFLAQPRAEHIKEQAVRINSVDSGYALSDLTEVLKAPNLDTIVVPKVNSAADLHFVTEVIQHALPDNFGSGDASSAARSPPRLLALIESAKSLTNLDSICCASPYLSGLIFAAEDFAHDLSITRTPSLTEFLFARSAIVTAARAHDLPSTIDLVCTSFRGGNGLQNLEQESADGKNLGFNGKQCIHPTQVETVSRVFSPSEEEIRWAVRVSIADSKADAQGRAAWTLDGKMIDVPVARKARAIVEKAKLCGVDVTSIQQEWKDQEPE